MSALIRKSKIKFASSGLFKGKKREKEEIAKEIPIRGISTRNLGLLLRSKGYKPERRNEIIENIAGVSEDESGPQELTWEQKMRLKQQERKAAVKEELKQKKLDDLEEKKRLEAEKSRPRELTWEQRKRLSWEENKKLKIEKRKAERVEELRQKKLADIEDAKRARRAMISGKVARRMEDSGEESSMKFISSNKPAKKIWTDVGSKSGFAKKPSSSPSSGGFAGSSSGGDFALGSKKGGSASIRPL